MDMNRFFGPGVPQISNEPDNHFGASKNTVREVLQCYHKRIFHEEQSATLSEKEKINYLKSSIFSYLLPIAGLDTTKQIAKIGLSLFHEVNCVTEKAMRAISEKPLFIEGLSLSVSHRLTEEIENYRKDDIYFEDNKSYHNGLANDQKMKYCSIFMLKSIMNF